MYVCIYNYISVLPLRDLLININNNNNNNRITPWGTQETTDKQPFILTHCVLEDR